MFSEKYKRDNDHITPDDKLLESLAKRMEDAKTSDSPPMCECAKKQTVHNIFKYTSIGAACVAIITISFIALSNTPRFFSVNYERDTTSAPLANQAMNDMKISPEDSETSIEESAPLKEIQQLVVKQEGMADNYLTQVESEKVNDFLNELYFNVYQPSQSEISGQESSNSADAKVVYEFFAVATISYSDNSSCTISFTSSQIFIDGTPCTISQNDRENLLELLGIKEESK